MYLERLEIQGFKSFVEKTTIELDKGITVIVGPNGSGKSNIVDALRWVLGEQSIKSLRGNKLEDIIFSGTKNRKSTGMAGVSITLNNSSGVFPVEYNEITVTRKVFRDGESRFFINKLPCRLREVQGLFMDTGLGKSAFAIISQGKVDDIVSSGAEERRPLFEEAAGITKYKYRKREAQQKVTETEKSLLRVADIISEIEEQLPSLVEESKKAEEYLTKTNLLDNLEYRYFFTEKEKILRRLEKIHEQAAGDDERNATAKNAVTILNRRLFDSKFLRDKAQDKISILVDVLGESSSKSEKYYGEEKLQKERINTLNRDIKELSEEIYSINSDIKKWQDSKDSYYHEINVNKDNIAMLNEKITIHKEKINAIKMWIATNDTDLKNINNTIINNQSMIAQYRNDITRAETKLNYLEKQNEKIIEQLEEKKNLLEKTTKEYNDEIVKLQKEKNILDEIILKISENENELEKILLHKNKIQEDILQAEEKKLKLDSRINLLRELEEGKEGYYPGVKFILNEVDKKNPIFKDIIATVADIIKVPDKLVLPIEIVLGSQLQNIVTLTDAVAEKTVDYLKKEKIGRVTFLPLNTISANVFNIDETIKKEEGFIGVASDLVTCESKYKIIINYLLGRVIVAENLNKGLRLAKKLNFKIRIVTLDGQLISPGGAITGGHIKTTNVNGLLSRKKELTDLNNQLEPINNEIKKIKSQLETVNLKENNFSEKIKELESAKEEHKIKISKNEDIANTLSEKQKLIDEEIILLNNEISMLKDQHNELTNIVDEYNNILIGIEKQNKTENQKTHNLKQTQKEKLEEVEILSTELHKMELEQNSWEQKQNMYNEKIRDLDGFIDNASKKVVTAEDRTENNTKQIKEIEAEMKINEYKIKNLLHQKENIKGVIQKLTQLRQDNINQIETLESIIAKVTRKNEERFKKEHLLQLEKTKLEAILDGIKQQISERFKEDFVCDLKEQSHKNLKTEIKILKDEIECLGPVNLGAIEQQKKLSERMSFLKSQKMDLEEANKSLSKVIKEIDSLIEEKFTKTFEKVNTHFTTIFQYLFSGGTASLVITNEDDLLNTGIDIQVQPPGKKLQNINLLSGGEKALTAIALLFAFLKVKPSPFCILDEIESSLDESNEQRFAKFLKELSKEIQFLVVSHRQGTMLTADNLYGVTMEEPGISKLVSVRINDGSLAM